MKLVLLPGMDGTGDMFAPLLQALGVAATVVVRYPVDQALDYAALEAVARAALPVDEPYVLLGESFSGPIAIAIAASAPPGLRGLLLCSTFARSPQPLLRPFGAFAGLLPVSWIPLPVKSALLMGHFFTADISAALGRGLGQVADATLLARLRAVLKVDVTGLLPGIRVPMLYLRASHDLLVPRACLRLIAARAPGMAVVELRGPHFLLQCFPKESAAVIEGFLRQVAP